MESPLSNPYSASTAELNRDITDGETYVPTLFSVKGRIGRVRYLGYSMAATLLFSFIIVGLTAAMPALAMLSLVLYIPMLAATTILAIRRLNDMDQSGWWSIAMFVPLVNFFVGLWLLFGRGTQGGNSYGPAPSANTRGVILLAWILPGIFIVGILAAVAIPAYQTYVQKAQAAKAQGF